MNRGVREGRSVREGWREGGERVGEREESNNTQAKDGTQSSRGLVKASKREAV